MINKADVEKAEAIERKTWELSHQADMVRQSLINVVHTTAEKRTKALAQEMRLTASGKPNPARLEYTRAKSAALRARLQLQLQRSAKEAQDLRAAILEFAKEVDLGPLLDSCPE